MNRCSRITPDFSGRRWLKNDQLKPRQSQHLKHVLLDIALAALKEQERGTILLTVGAFLLTVELLCLQSVEALLGHSFPL